MTHIMLNTIAASLASLATLLRLTGRPASRAPDEAPARTAAVAVSRPQGAAGASAVDSPAAAIDYPDRGYGYCSGFMAGAMGAPRGF
jgi:hypothetical protein